MLTRLFWIKVICVVPVNGYGFSPIGIVLGLLAQRGSGCPSQGKRYESDGTALGQWKILLLGNVPLGYQSRMKKVTLCNHGQGPERDFGYGKSWHIPNYELFKLFKRAYHLLDFQKVWIFHEHQSVIVRSQVLFNSKSDYLKCQYFGSEGGKMFIRTDLLLIMTTNFQV